MSTKKRSLGRNLEALLGDLTPTKMANEFSPIEGELQQLPLDKISAGKYQPRKEFPQEQLEELANSIRVQGIIQPIVVRSKNKGNYEIIAGERRFRAAKLAGLTSVPALIRELPDEAVVAVALIENIQRQDLNPIEEALALQRLISEFALTHEQVANAVGKSRTMVSNLLRLLNLAEVVKDLLTRGKIEMGHARALINLQPQEQIKIANLITEKSLSVRQTEDMVRKIQENILQNKLPPKQDAYLHDLENNLSKNIGFPVLIQQNAKGKGKLIIKYKNARELEKIYAQLSDLNS